MTALTNILVYGGLLGVVAMFLWDIYKHRPQKPPVKQEWTQWNEDELQLIRKQRKDSDS